MNKSAISATRRNPTAFDLRYWSSYLWPRWSLTFEKLNWTARFNSWLKEHKPYIFSKRIDVYRAINPEGPICLLEFGVYKGEGLIQWSGLNQHVNTRLHGFDAFEGQRGEPGSPFKKGSFAVKNAPEFADPRVSLHIGWVEDTLPTFDGFPVQQEDTLIINLDMDDFEPTLFILTTINKHIRPGTIILLDEASVAECEFQAFLHWVRSFRREYKVRAAWKHGLRVEGVAVEITK